MPLLSRFKAVAWKGTCWSKFFSQHSPWTTQAQSHEVDYWRDQLNLESNPWLHDEINNVNEPNWKFHLQNWGNECRRVLSSTSTWYIRLKWTHEVSGFYVLPLAEEDFMAEGPADDISTMEVLFQTVKQWNLPNWVFWSGILL